MIKEKFNKEFFLLLIFSFSIFFSYVSVLNLQIRFLYLTSLIFLFFDIENSKKLFLSKLSFVSLIISFCIYIYSIFFYLFEFENIRNNFSFYDFITSQFNLKLFGQIIIIYFTILIIFFYKNFIIKNLRKIVDLFVVTFVISIIIYNFKNQNILIQTLFTCDLGFFYFTKFLFSENSHFGIISASIITYFFFNIKDYLNRKILIWFYLIFFIFGLGTMSLTFYLSMVSSIFISLIFCNKKTKNSIFSLLILFMVVNCYFYFQKDIFYKTKEFYSYTKYKFTKDLNIEDKHKYCSSNHGTILNKYDFPKITPYTGNIVSNKSKLRQIFKKDISNISISVFLYSFYTAGNSIITYPLGSGLNNYINYRKIFDEQQIIVGGYPYEQMILKNAFFKSINAYSIDFNKNSGSNNFSKLIVEFGFLGLMLLVFIFYVLCSKKIDNSFKILLVTMFINQVFVRGTGYFYNGFLITIILLFLIFFNNKIKKNVKDL